MATRYCASSTVAYCSGVEKASRAKPCNFHLRLPSPSHGIPRTSTISDRLLRGIGNLESPENVFIPFPHKRHRLCGISHLSLSHLSLLLRGLLSDISGLRRQTRLFEKSARQNPRTVHVLHVPISLNVHVWFLITRATFLGRSRYQYGLAGVYVSELVD